ncbi:SUP-10 protein [Aphelenchoides avenae]|nr:SUP-10 protein [Aphelenchus avenae]
MHSTRKIFWQSFVPITVALFIVNAHITDDGIDPTEILASDKSIARTLAKISEDGNEGRLVVLVCRNKCTRQRAQVPKWVREFNAEQSIDAEQAIGYHFHYMKHRFPFFDVERKLHRSPITVMYVVAGRAFHYEGGDPTSESAFKQWLRTMESPPIIQPDNYVMLDEIIEKARECDTQQRYLLLVHDLELCRDYLLYNIGRSFHDLRNLTVVELRRPLSSQEEVLIQFRLPGTSGQCRMIIVLGNRGFEELDRDLTPAELYNKVVHWRRDCETPPFIREDEENHYMNAGQKKAYIMVGAIGGIAVIALAISIFWGLNGTAFVEK